MILKAFVVFALVGLSAAAVLGPSLLIAAFNIKDFGISKMTKRDVVASLIEIVHRYDLIVIQEIVDKTGLAFSCFTERVNAADSRYTYNSFISPRFGRGSRKEQYGYIYRKEKVKLLRWGRIPPNNRNIFEREPYIVQFECLAGCHQRIFNTIVLHAKPDDAVNEISNLVPVYDYAVSVTHLTDAVILGDLNADCDYVKAADWPNIALRKDGRFTWWIGNDADTSVTRHCAYDRIITAGAAMTRNSGQAAVYNFATALGLDTAQAKAVSDHFPVEFRLS